MNLFFNFNSIEYFIQNQFTKIESAHHSRDWLSYKVDPLKVVLLLPINVLAADQIRIFVWQYFASSDQREEVAVIDDWSVFPHFGHLIH